MRTTFTLSFAFAFVAVLCQAGFSQANVPKEDIFNLLAPPAEDDAQIDAEPTPAIEPKQATDIRPVLPIENENNNTGSARRPQPAESLEPVIADGPPSGTVDVLPVDVPSLPSLPSVASQQVRLLLAPAPESAQTGTLERPLLVEKPGLLTRLSDDELRVLLDLAVAECARDFSGIQYGERWIDFLRLEQLQRHTKALSGASGQAGERQTLSDGIQPARKRFVEIAGDPKYQVITKRPSFEAVYLALNEYTAPPNDRQQRREVFDSVQKLSASLRPAATGGQWNEFLKMAELERLLALPGPRTAEESAQLKQILTRFEQAAGQSQFKTVTALPGFADTHRHLQHAVASFEQPGGQATVQLSGKPLPEGVGPLLRLVGREGPCFYRQPHGERWTLIEQVQPIASGSSIRTADEGTAQLLIGEHSKLLIAPETTFSVTQYIDDSNRIITSIDAADGNLSLVVDGQQTESETDGNDSVAGRRILLKAKDYRIVAGESRLALQLRLSSDEARAYAAVYLGKAEVAHVKTGDRVLLRPGREAVLVPQGIALRAAPERNNAEEEEGPAASTATRPNESPR